MKTLLVLRHAKSSWSDSTIDDHARPLNPRGLRDAPRVGTLVREQELTPDLLIASDAVRARETAAAVARAAGYTREILLDPSLYLADPEAIYAVLGARGAHTNRIMIVGHNPGLSQLVAQLTGDDEELPTAGLAHIALPIQRWDELRRSTRGTLVARWRPKHL
jgi:phosphohistidine phosphatase